MLITVDLVEKAKRGDDEAFVELIEANKKLMYYCLKKYINNDEDIADVSQDSILKAFKYLKSLKDSNKFRAWFLCIAMNEAKLFLKSKLDYVSFDETTEFVQRDACFDKVEIQDAIERLEGDLKEITDLYYLKDISIKSISIHLNMPVGTVKYKLHLARKELFRMLSSRYKK